jgi:transposase
MSMTAIARETGIPYPTVRSDCIALGLKTERTSPLPDPAMLRQRREREAAAYAEGQTLREIAQREGVSHFTIAHDLKRLGIARRVGAPPRRYEQPAERECARPGCSERFTPTAVQVADGYGKYHSLSCAYLDRWHRTGNGIADELLANANIARPGTRKHFKRTWAGHRPPRPGSSPRGRPRVDDPKTVDAVILYAARGDGERTIAIKIGRSRNVVRRLLAEHGDAIATRREALKTRL